VLSYTRIKSSEVTILVEICPVIAVFVTTPSKYGDLTVLSVICTPPTARRTPFGTRVDPIPTA
jgi:hypothetical protein